jgi:NADH-quinone oxidoreductase subunit M
MSANHETATSGDGHDNHGGGDSADAPILPVTAGQLFQYLLMAAAAAVLVAFVPGTLPVVIAFAVAALMPRRTAGSLGLRLAMGVMAGLLAYFVVRMWPGQPDTDELSPESPALLSWLIALPILSAIAVLFLPRQSPTLIKGFTLVSMLGVLALALPLLHNAMGRSFHYNYDVIWLAQAGVHFHVAIDGISLWLVLLTLFIVPIAAFASFGSITTRVKDWCFALLLLEGAMVGTFVSLDLIVFYVFFELGLVPMYIMIGVWGGTNRIKASIKFFLYTMFGSVLMLAAILYMGFHYARLNGSPSFDFFDLQRMVFPRSTQVWLFAAFALAFFIKVPMFPVHTWLPDAHTEAPTAGSMILAAVMLKMGTYGYLRFCMGLFPEACSEYAATLAGVAVVGGILYGALCAWKQDDIKKLVAYSSVAHLGYVMLGLFANTSSSIEGSVLQMINHGISTGLLFLLVGMVYDRRHTRHVDDYGGIAKVMPVYSALFIIATMASVGLPGTNGFVGEFMIITGTFVSTKLGHVNGVQAVGATLGVILAALYMLTMVQKVFFGPLNNPENKRLKDINPREMLAAAPLVAFVFIIGLFPRIFLDTMHGACGRVQSEMQMRVERYPGPTYHRGPIKLEARRPDAPKPVALPADPAPQAQAAATEPSLRVN